MEPITRKLVFHKSQQFTGWACTVCQWARPIPRAKFGGDKPGNIETDFANHKCAKYPEELRVRVLPCSRIPAIAVPGRGAGLGQGGMALHAAVDMELDDLVEIEFPTPHPVSVMAAVRNRNGRCFGLEFVARLHGQTGGLPKNRPPALPEPHAKVADSVKIADPALAKKIFAALDRKLLEIARVQREIEALIVAAPLLAE